MKLFTADCRLQIFVVADSPEQAYAMLRDNQPAPDRRLSVRLSPVPVDKTLPQRGVHALPLTPDGLVIWHSGEEDLTLSEALARLMPDAAHLHLVPPPADAPDGERAPSVEQQERAARRAEDAVASLRADLARMPKEPLAPAKAST